MGKMNDIKTALAAIVADIEYSGSTAFVDVHKRGTNNFTGYPSATIVNAEIRSEYHTSAQNLRTYVVYVYLYMSLEDIDQQAAWDTLTDLQELIIDAIDRTENFDGITDFVRPSAIEPLESNAGEGGMLLCAPIKVEAGYSFYFK